MKKKQQNVTCVGYILRIFLIIVLSPVLLFYFIVQKIKKRKNVNKKAQNLAIYSILQVDCLSGTEFEAMLLNLFKALGFNVRLTSATKDFGADLIAKRDGKIFVIQAKRYSKTVGAHAVQEVIGAKNHYNATDAMVVSNNYFSNEAKTIALENDIKLIDRSNLKVLLSKANITIEHKGTGFSTLAVEEKAKLESRYKYLI